MTLDFGRLVIALCLSGPVFYCNCRVVGWSETPYAV